MKSLTKILAQAVVGLALAVSFSPVVVPVVAHADGLHADGFHDRDFDRRRDEEARRFHDHHPVYAPAPVVYTPPPSPGIALVLPIVIR